MKRFFTGLLALCFLAPSIAFAAVAAESRLQVKNIEYPSSEKRIVRFLCTGNIDNTDLSANGLKFIRGWYLYEVTAYPESGGTAPDAADVMIYDANGMDLLGSVDGGTTPYRGAGLIHATLTRTCIPDKYIANTGTHQPFFPVIMNTITLDVDNQGTAAATFYVDLIFVR